MQLKSESEMPLDQTAPTLGTNRRNLMKTAGIGAAAVGATLAVSSTMVPAQAQSGPSVGDVLNFALNLEYLEAEFYLRATTGHGLASSETTGPNGEPGGGVVGGSMVPFHTPRLRAIATDIATDEHAHVLFLRSALGSSFVAEPAIDLSKSFTMLARAAGFIGPTATFDPFVDEDSFLVGAYIFEDVGVSAYSGAAGYLTGSPSVLAAAAGILAVEAYHGGAIRSNLILSSPAYYNAADAISKLRQQLSQIKGQPPITDEVGPFRSGIASISNSDSNSIAYARTPSQVLNIVYGGGAASEYLFFPNKLNGAIS